MVKLAKADHYTRGGPVRYQVRETPDGKIAAVSITIAYDEAPVPDHYYIADYYQVVPQDLDVLLIFGKLDHPKTDKLRNKVEIYFPVHLFVQQLWKSSRDFQKTLETFIEGVHAQPVGPSDLPPDTDKVQTLHANNVLMVLSAGQSIMDFFYISAKDLWLKPAKGEPIGIEALVRVIIPAPVLLGFLQECDRLVPTLVENFEIKLSEDEDAIVESK